MFGSMYGMMVVGGVLWLMILAGAGILLYVVVRSLSGPARASPDEDDPLAIAQIRYARGELTREQYEEMCRVLAGKPLDPS
ncbi:MAG: hypothetical protein M0Z54_11290 [Thermaerobacter sp.]|nr:hypothetical protein [Thermaerobacter sp.]